MAKISVIIPCYNVEKLIDRCLESIERQTIGIENLEILLVDDASTDHTLEKLNAWESKYPDAISVISSSENLRQGGARNLGMRRASSAYIGFVDADDWIEPDMYQALYEKMQEKDYDVVRGKFLRHDAKGGYDERMLCQRAEDQEYYFNTYHGYYLADYRNVGNVGEFGCIVTGLYRRDLIFSHQCFFPEKLAYEDNYWAEILSLYTKSCYIIDKICYHYMTNPDSTVMKKNSANHLDRLEIEMMKIAQYKKLGLLENKDFYEKIQGSFILLYYLNTLFLMFTRFDQVPVDIVNRMIQTTVEEFPNWENGKFLETMNELQLSLLQLLKKDSPMTQPKLDEVIGIYCMRRKYLHGYLGEYIRRIRHLWKENPQQITLEEQAYFYKIKEDMSGTQEEILWLAYEMEQLQKECSLERKIYVYTFLIDVTGDKKFAILLMQMVRREKRIPKEVKYFLYGQIKSKAFLGKTASDDTGLKTELYQFLQETAEEFKNAVKEELIPIPQKDRNPNMVIAITEQFLNEAHGPTKSAMARCAVLKKMGKQILLINTAEQMTKAGAIQGFDFRLGNYRQENSAMDKVEWEGIEIPFFQCDQNMPDIDVLKYLLGVVRELKPCYILAIGGDGIFVSLVRHMLPTLAVGMVPSDIGISLAGYQTLGRKINDRDMEYLQKIGKRKMQIIEHKFTSDLRKQNVVLTRADIGLKEGFVLAAVSGRLEDELSDAFWEMLLSIFEQEDAMMLFLGKFEKEQEVLQKYPMLESKIRFEGSVAEVLAYLELCDLYVNPIRVGGGTSCVEAMSKGLPVVTTEKGDVALNAGKDFFVKDYDEMKDMILRYIRDRKFYHMQSQKAKARADELMDTDKAFREVIHTFLEREGMPE